MQLLYGEVIFRGLVTLSKGELAMRKLIVILLVLLIAALALKFKVWTLLDDYESNERRLARLEIDKTVSKLNLEAIGQAISFYIASSSDPDEVPPSTLEELVERQSLQPALLISPMSGRDRDKITIDERGVLSEPSDYVYIALPKTAPDTLIQAYEKPANYKDSPWGEGTLVLFKQRQYRKIIVEWMDIKSFQTALRRTNKWLAESNFKPGSTDRADSKKNLRLIGNEIASFRSEYDAPPSSLEDIIRFSRMSQRMDGYEPQTDPKFLRALVSPASGRGPLKTDKNGVPTEPGDYVYIPLPNTATDTLIQAYERPENYKGSEWGEGTLVLFYPKSSEYQSAELKWMDLTSFQTALERTQKWVAEHNYGPSQATLDIETSRRSSSMHNLWRIGLKITSHRIYHNDLPPPSLERLAEGFWGDTEFLGGGLIMSPMSGREPILLDKHLRVVGKGDYVLVPLPKSAPPGLIEIYERPDNYAGSPLGEGTIVLTSPLEKARLHDVTDSGRNGKACLAGRLTALSPRDTFDCL